MSNRPDPAELQRRLERLSAALSRTPQAGLPLTAPPPAGPPARGNAARNAGIGVAALSTALIVVGIATGQALLTVTGAFLLLVSAAFLVINAGSNALSNLTGGARDASRPYIGMGATVEDGATVEPGGVVEMGATVRAGARIKRGAILRMGATLEADATLEEGAVVGWGADIKRGAVVGAGATIGAGATVNPKAIVPAKMRILPGATWAQTVTTGATLASAVAPLTDPRVERIDAACKRIEAELQRAPEQIRAHLGASAGSVMALKDTSRALLERERSLRAEASPESFTFLDQEQKTLEERLAAATDPGVRKSLQSALAALGDQRTQRESVRVSADRLDAEITRMQYTLEGMATQLVRLRTAGEANVSPTSEVLENVQQLHEEIDAIASALEELTAPPRGFEPIAPVEGAPTGLDGRQKTR